MNIDDSTATHLHALAETTSDALLTIDADSRIQFANPAVEDILGYAPAELIGESLTVLMPDDLGRRHLDAIDRYLSTGTRTLDWDHIELPGRHKDGHEVPLEISFSEFARDGDRFFTGVLRDVSDRRTLESERDLLQAAGEQVVEAETFGEGLENALGLIGESMNWVYGGAWVRDDDSGRLECEATWTANASDLETFRSVTAETTFEPGEGLAGRVWETGEYAWIPDVSGTAESEFKRKAAATDDGLRAALAVPIRANDSVVAVLVFLMREERAVDERVVETTRTVAASLGLLMARKRAEEALREERNLVSNILETSPVGIVVVDAGGGITYANERAEQILRLESDDGDRPNLSYQDLPVQLLDEGGDPLPESERPDRYVLRTGSDVTRDLQVQYPDGERRWLSVHGTPLRDEADAVSAAVIAVRDVTERERRADRLERVNELGQALSEAETFEEACERIVAAAADVLDLSLATVERYDAETGALEPCARTARVEELVGDDSLFGAERGLPWQAFVENEAHVYADLGRETDLEPDETPLASAMIVPLGSHGVFISGATAPDAFDETTETLARILAQNVAAAFDRLDREASLRERASELETKNEQLRRVQRVNRDIRDITQALRDADSTAEIKQLVCDKLADGDPYRFVWFGERDLVTDEIVPSAQAGAEKGYLDAVTITADADAMGQGPTGRAIRTREAQMQNDIQSNPPFEPWRQEAIQRGYRASIAVPVVYRDTLYGLLNLYANEPGVFTETERAVLTELGEMIGYALSAMERYDALVSEDSVELEFVIRDFTDPLLGFLREEGGQFRLETIDGRDSGEVRVFGVFEGVPFDRIRAFADQYTGIGDLTLIRDRGEEIVVELALAADAFAARLLNWGAVPTAIRATPSEGRMTIRISKSASVREFVERFEQRYDDVDLVARREAPDPVQTEESFERAYLDRLTERQREVLRTAYVAGFFEQPRESTAGDIADMLDVSQPTVSRHIRSGEQKLFAMLFDHGSSD